ncbi:hypothetical protein [Naasia aerilata]|uniref:Uncharacterized protein n=1 Tax=Naasia aerilata TaxID=1162966 RepID=A0ABM8G7I7_9MICO|nr:hypothetical protein [Naasia aerilata]BDZ44131.1 hypothetical protein GCM10025866_00400 [Naasia aerilata]
MSTQAYVLRPDSLRADERQVTLVVGLPWYRALPWAGVADVRVTLDGRPVEVVSVDGRDLGALQDDPGYWGIQRRAEVVLDASARGASVAVGVHVDLLIPGPTKPDGSPMDFAFETERRLTAA